MPRRLDIHGAKKLRGRARHERAFFAAMDALDTWQPDTAIQPFENVKLPAYEKVVYTTHGNPAFRRAVVERLLTQAVNLASRTPSRVAAIIDWPGLFQSELCVFHDPAYAKAFDPAIRAGQRRPARTEWDGGWVEARDPDTDLLADLHLIVPEGFTAHGITLTEYNHDTAITNERSEWVVMQSLPSARSLP